MAQPISKVAAGWWDYTTLDPQILKEIPNIDERRFRNAR